MELGAIHMIPEWLSFWNEFIPSPCISQYLGNDISFLFKSFRFSIRMKFSFWYEISFWYHVLTKNELCSGLKIANRAIWGEWLTRVILSNAFFVYCYNGGLTAAVYGTVHKSSKGLFLHQSRNIEKDEKFQYPPFRLLRPEKSYGWSSLVPRFSPVSQVQEWRRFSITAMLNSEQVEEMRLIKGGG